jgi:subfamily B ATP-binding cassette protein MsbA
MASLLTAAQPIITAPILEIAVNGPQSLNQITTSPPVDLASVNLNSIAQYLLKLFFPNQVDAWEVVVSIALIYLLISVALHLINFIVYLMGILIRYRASRDMQIDLFSHVANLSLDFFNKTRTGELISRLDKDTDAVVYGLESITRDVIVSGILVLIYGSLLIKTSLSLTLFVLVAAGAQYVFVRTIRTPLKKRVREQFNVQADVLAYLQEVLSNIRIVKSFAAEIYEVSRLKKLIKRAIHAEYGFSIFKHVDEPVTFIINSAVNVIILLFATNEMLTGKLTSTGFFLYLYIGRSVLSPLTTLAQSLKEIQAIIATSERVQSLFGEQTTILGGSILKSDFQDKIDLKNVSFIYAKEPVLRNVNLEIKRGQTVALVGHSGAGKSTLTDLILRFYDPSSGQITIDGQDLRSLNLPAYRRMFGVVSQESILFNASVAENIAYPDSDFDNATIEAAAHVANAHEFVLQLPEGYSTLVGDRGVLLSGGQKQRITIARAIYQKPQIIILDEATSSLDTESERLVQQAVENVIEQTTAIVIAHRLSTIVHSDKIVVMDQGRVIDVGKHAELLGRCEIYKRLCELQFEFRTNDSKII